MDREQYKTKGDLITSPEREYWQNKSINIETKYWLEEDSRYLLHQSLSNPCLNVMDDCNGTSFKDLEGRSYLDFHGNNVHNLGFSNPEVIEAIINVLFIRTGTSRFPKVIF